MSICCQSEERRDAVRALNGWNGLDYVEVSDDQRSLQVFFLGKLPEELRQDAPGLERYLHLEGGERVTDIRILDVDPHVDPDPETDDYLVVTLDKYGDFSTYKLWLVGVEHIDPHYAYAEFSFKVDCPQNLDCAPVCLCEPEVAPEPDINYLAKDYASFRQLIFDRLALLAPEYGERHVPDMGVALVELLAYTADYLSYQQDAVATEAYLDTARKRISVRRHARLVDYFLHEGCNARAWLSLVVSQDLALDPLQTFFITGMNEALAAGQTQLRAEDLVEFPAGSYEVFEPLVADSSTPVKLYAAHNEIRFYTWGNRECCLARCATSATLLDAWVTAPPPPPVEEVPDARDIDPSRGSEDATPIRALSALAPGDLLLFEEVRGAKTGLAADADPARRHVVRLTKVSPAVDPTVPSASGEPTALLRIEWAPEDALPFPLCLSAIGAPPQCRYLEDVSIARGNLILVDHGQTQPPEDLGEVPPLSLDAECECPERTTDIRYKPGRIRPCLSKAPLTFAEPLVSDLPGIPGSAAALIEQDVKSALPEVALKSLPEAAWEPRRDLIGSGPEDAHFVVEMNNEGVAALRFGDGELGLQPPAGMDFTATYRIGNGRSGNVGAESISRLVLRSTLLSGVSISVRNPLPARGGTDPELIADAKLAAPHAFRQQIERAVIAEDYAELAERNQAVQRAAAQLVWTGSWLEADVAIDPLGLDKAPPALLAQVEANLGCYRRMGHDLHLRSAECVPLDIELQVCVSPDAPRSRVKAELLDIFSNRVLPGGERGFFHVDRLSFGEGVFLSHIVAAAQPVSGVVSVRVTRLQRLFSPPNKEIENGLLPLGTNEIARLDNDPNYPEHGRLEIDLRGGR